MILPVATQVTTPRENTQALKIQGTVLCRRNNTHIKIDQVGIVGAVPLGVTDAVRIMTGIAGCTDISYMLIMGSKGFIIQNAGSAVTSVAKLIGGSRFYGIICSLVLIL